MHRFAVDQPIREIGERVALPREESEHAFRVLRLRAGEAVQLLDGSSLYDGELVTVGSDGVTAIITARCPSPEPPARVTLWQGLPKADKLEWIVQKSVELGAWELWPVEMGRSVAKGDANEKKRERLNRIALEAAKQSGRAHVPAVAPVRSMKQALAAMEEANFDLALVAWEEEKALPLSRALFEHGAFQRALLIIGPEGGISVEEKEALAARGAVSVTLGKRILRTETAGLAALAATWAALGEM